MVAIGYAHTHITVTIGITAMIFLIITGKHENNSRME